MESDGVAVVSAPRYITGITREQLEAMLAMANVTVGPGIEIRRGADGLSIGVNEAQLKRWMWAFYKNGGHMVSYDAIDSVSIDVYQ